MRLIVSLPIIPATAVRAHARADAMIAAAMGALSVAGGLAGSLAWDPAGRPRHRRRGAEKDGEDDHIGERYEQEKLGRPGLARRDTRLQNSQPAHVADGLASPEKVSSVPATRPGRERSHGREARFRQCRPARH